MFKLTPKQVSALETVRWLFARDKNNAHIGQGRTTLLAYYFITEAIDSGQWVEIFDHHRPRDYANMIHTIRPRIIQMLNEFWPEYDFEYNNMNSAIRVFKRSEK